MQSALVDGGNEIGIKGMITEVLGSIYKLAIGAFAALLIMVLSSRPLLCQNLPNLVHTVQSVVTVQLSGSGVLPNLSSGSSAQVSGAVQRLPVETSGIPLSVGSQMQMPVTNALPTGLTAASVAAAGVRQTPTQSILGVVPTPVVPAPVIRLAGTLSDLRVLKHSVVPVVAASQPIEGTLVKMAAGTDYSQSDPGTLELKSGTLLVSVRRPAKQVMVQTPLGKVWIIRGADALVTSKDGIIRVDNLDGLGDSVRVKIENVSAMDSKVLAIPVAFELVAAQRSVSSSDLFPKDGVARRHLAMIGDIPVAVSEIWLPTLLKSNALLAQLRFEDRLLGQKVLNDIVKMAAVITQARGTQGIEPPTVAAVNEIVQTVGNLPNTLIAGLPGTPPGRGPELPPQPLATNSGTNVLNTQATTPVVLAPPQALQQPLPVIGVSTDATPVGARFKDQWKPASRDRHAKRAKSSEKYSDAITAADTVPTRHLIPANSPVPNKLNAIGVDALRRNTVHSAQSAERTTVASELNLLPLVVPRIASEVVREHPEATLAAMVIIASLLAVLAYMARTARMKAELLDMANKRLLGEVNERQVAEEQVRQLNRDLEGRLAEHAILNQSLQAARDQAFEASRLKSEFVANISHELRTPLSIVLGMNSMLLESDLTAEQRDDATQANSAAQSLLMVVNDLLDFSKMEAGKVSLENVEFSPATVLSQVVSMCAPTAKEKNVLLISNLSQAVPNTVRGDEGKLRQSLLNLLANAVKFTENGQIAIDVRVESESLHTVSLLLSVKDTGIGIASQALKNLFQPFVQADGSSTRKYGGSGLGLSITKRLVELMDGSVHVESRLGEGSHFWMVIPFSKIEPAVK